jgi:carboxypeptidase C (cathepsin A)
MGLRVLIFAGQYDIICNHLGVEKAIMRLNWRYRTEWQQTPTGTWIKDGKVPAG